MEGKKANLQLPWLDYKWKMDLIFLKVLSFHFVNIYKNKTKQTSIKTPNHKIYLRYFTLLSLQYLVLKSYLGQNHLVIETTLLQGTKHSGNANATYLV